MRKNGGDVDEENEIEPWQDTSRQVAFIRACGKQSVHVHVHVRVHVGREEVCV
jgi:hypothetical protein